MKIAICDDEQIFRDTLYKKLVKYNKTFEIKEFRTGRELIDSRIKFDIIFLDICQSVLSLFSLRAISNAYRMRSRLRPLDSFQSLFRKMLLMKLSKKQRKR